MMILAEILENNLDLQLLYKTNKIIIKNNKIYIELNKPSDFVYDLDSLFVAFDDELEYKEVVGNVPKNILDNMNMFNSADLKEFVEFLERNLNIFCSGKIPPKEDIKVKQDLSVSELNVLDKDMVELNNYKYVINSSITPNLKMNVFKENIFMFMCEEINLKVKCKRCNALTDICCQKEKDFNCTKCNNLFNSNYLPVFNEEYLGFIQLKNCEIAIFDQNNYQIGCEGCQKNYLTRKISVGEKFISKCFYCHKTLKFQIDRIYLITQRKIQIKEGTELPDKGTCKHYTKSYRWFRFTCCNSLYPCGDCHDKETNHPSELANRMVCGFCSKEQSVKKECDCGMSIKRKATKFWEGGKGNRNKETMSRKDSRKNKR